MDEDPLNFSDHRPLIATLKDTLGKPKSSPAVNKPARSNWAKLIHEDIAQGYTKSVNHKLSYLPCPSMKSSCDNPQSIDAHIVSISGVLLSAAKETVPQKSFCPHKKPGWSSKLSKAQRASKAAFRTWKAAGRPRNPDHPIRRHYYARLTSELNFVPTKKCRGMNSLPHWISTIPILPNFPFHKKIQRVHR